MNTLLLRHKKDPGPGIRRAHPATLCVPPLRCTTIAPKPETPIMTPPIVTHRGQCHCGAIRFEVEAPADIEASRCNCSICSMAGFLHLIVPRSRFRASGDHKMTTYRFNTGIAQHTFCPICGIKPFYVPRSNPDGVSVNVNCLDSATIASIRETPFDGRHWEQNADSLRHLFEQ